MYDDQERVFSHPDGPIVANERHVDGLEAVQSRGTGKTFEWPADDIDLSRPEPVIAGGIVLVALNAAAFLLHGSIPGELYGAVIAADLAVLKFIRDRVSPTR